MSKVIGVRIDNEDSFHAGGVVSDYDTLCGVDADDPNCGHHGIIPTPRGQKITCIQCQSIWQQTMALKLRQSDFKVTP